MADEEEADVTAMLDLSKKKKKKKKKKADKESGSSGGAVSGADMSAQEALLAEQDAAQDVVEDEYDRKGEYNYEELLNLVVDLLQLTTRSWSRRRNATSNLLR
jgi:hypothetical protein